MKRIEKAGQVVAGEFYWVTEADGVERIFEAYKSGRWIRLGIDTVQKVLKAATVHGPIPRPGEVKKSRRRAAKKS